MLDYFSLGISHALKEVYKLDTKVSFKNDKFNHLIRKQHFNELDVLSYVGGLLGLFAGFSVLSFIELFYWFTIRSFLEKFNKLTSKVTYLNEQNPRAGQVIKLKTFLVNYFKESSIHGLGLISGSNIIQGYLKI